MEGGLEKAVHWCHWEVTAHSLFRSSRKQSMEDGVKKLFFWETEHWVDTIVLLKKYSWKGFSLVTLGKTQLCMFIVQVSQETELWVAKILLLERWSCKGHSSVPLGRLCSAHSLFRSFRRSSSCWHSSFTLKMVLKWSFIGEIGEETHHFAVLVYWETEIFWVGWVILGYFWNARALSDDTVGRD